MNSMSNACSLKFISVLSIYALSQYEIPFDSNHMRNWTHKTAQTKEADQIVLTCQKKTQKTSVIPMPGGTLTVYTTLKPFFPQTTYSQKTQI